ncbi:MAG: hypothetical protein ACI92S_001776, partial [Planctomycetaceae bacterium]
HTGLNEQNTDIPTSHPALIHGSTSSGLSLNGPFLAESKRQIHICENG